MRFSILLAIPLAISGCSKSGHEQPTKEDTAKIETQVLADWSAANDTCRGSSGPESDAACKQRDQIDKKLGSLGFCYGRPTDRAGADAYWHKCSEAGAANMPSQMKGMANACQIAIAQESTYPDSYHWASLQSITFLQDRMTDLPKLSENPTEKEINALTTAMDNHVAISVTIPFTYEPFGAPSSKGKATCTFTSDSLGGVQMKDHMQDFDR